MDAVDRYWQSALSQLGRLREVNADVLKAAAKAAADRMTSGGRYLLFGCGHSGLVAQDAYYRAGGLRSARALFAPPVSLDFEPIAETSVNEKSAGWIGAHFESENFGSRDVLILISTSGVNAAPVELALHAKKMNTMLIAITSKAYTDRISPRHPSGKRLSDCADFVFDNLVPYGDALVDVDNHRTMGSAGTAAGALLVQAFSIALWDAAAKAGTPLATYESGNLPGGMERNAKDQG